MLIIEGLLPMVQCFSCMSKSLQDDFQYLSRIYLPQQTFDDRCNEPFMDKNMPVVNCSNICVTLKESEQTFVSILDSPRQFHLDIFSQTPGAGFIKAT
uniref:Uncharacterized protein n=1 Tax=Romanomermis culicivorax TaxID=13658 RepID=A0A915JUM9_ROMCU